MRFGIRGKARRAALRKVLPRLLAELRDLGQECLLAEELAELAWSAEENGPRVERVSAAELSASCDILLSLGGDGAMLGAVRDLEHDRPVLGLQMGHLGFLTSLHPDALRKGLEQVIRGEAIEERRMTLELELKDSNGTRRARALNDIVLHSARPGRITRIRTRIDRVDLFSLVGDGLIHATPTGSTAYSLSGGGPLMDPSMEAILLTPLMAHSLTHRPMVLGPEAVIESRAGERGAPLKVTVDGQLAFRLRREASIRVCRGPRPARLLHLDQQGFLKTLRDKLQWNREES